MRRLLRPDGRDALNVLNHEHIATGNDNPFQTFRSLDSVLLSGEAAVPNVSTLLQSGNWQLSNEDSFYFTYNTKTRILIGNLWRITVAICVCTIACGTIPATTTNHSAETLQRPLRVFQRTTGIILSLIKIAAPFPNVTVHVIQAKSVAPSITDDVSSLHCFTATVPPILVQCFHFISITPSLLTTATASVFPFGFRWQSLATTFLPFCRQLRKTQTKLLCVVPTD